MTSPEPAGPGPQHSGLLQSLRGLGATALGVLKTRAELLISEIEEERLRVLELLVWGAAATLLFAFGLMMFTFALIVAFWDTHRVAAAVFLGFVYLAGAVALFMGARSRAQRPRLFAASLEELDKDRDSLTSR